MRNRFPWLEIAGVFTGDCELLAERQLDVSSPWRQVEHQEIQRAPRLAVDESVILLHPPSTFSRCINSGGERASAK